MDKYKKFYGQTTRDIMDYLEHYIVQTDWTKDDVSERGRAIFTAYCLMEGVDPNSRESDRLLLHLY